ncbi:MAG: hypothetical protein MSH11_02070 [Ruminococcus sp.]|nr:hypothetical protein [Ruminococcus sp.]
MVNHNMIDLGKIYGLTGEGSNRYLQPNTSDVVNIPSLEQIATAHRQSMDGVSSTPGISNGESRLPGNIAEGAVSSTGEENLTDVTNPGTTATGRMVPISSPIRTNLETGTGTNPIEEQNQPFLVNAQNIQYLNSFARTQIGRMVQVNFLAGSTTMLTLEGTLLGVGANFLMINERGTNDITTCDFYSIKYMRFYY